MASSAFESFFARSRKELITKNNMEPNRLIKAISSLLIIEHYHDSKCIGREDDITRDYYSIGYNGDKYIQSCFEQGLKDMSIQKLEFLTIYNYDHDSNAVRARSPNRGYYFNNDFTELKYMLLLMAAPYYDEILHNKYLKSDEHNKRKEQLKSNQLKFTPKKKDYFSGNNSTISIEINNDSIETSSKIYDITILDTEVNLSRLLDYINHLYLSETT